MDAAPDCAPLPNAPLAPHWLELCADYDVGEDDAALPFVNNNVARDAVAFPCGRIASAAAAAPHAHAAGEAERCGAIAARAEAALAGLYVGLGDEGDHRWRAFSAPALLGGHGGGDAGGAVGGLVTPAELRAALGGALVPGLEFRAVPLADALADFARRRETEVDPAREPNRVAGEGECFGAFERALGGGGVGNNVAAAAGFEHGSQTYLRPLDVRVAGGGCVFPHFLVARTLGGSLVGVLGSTVWT